MQGHHRVTVGGVTREDLEALVALIHDYCLQTLRVASTLDVAALERDGFGRHFDAVVARDETGASSASRPADRHTTCAGGSPAAPSSTSTCRRPGAGGASHTLSPALKVEGRPGWSTVREAVYGS